MSIAKRPTEQSARPASYDAILLAAVDEYAAHGRDGVRIERVAERAGVNKSLVYRHFKDRDALFEAALHHVFQQRTALLKDRPEDPETLMRLWNQRFARDPLFVRMLLREALESNGPVPHVKERSAYYARQIADVLRMQRQGKLPDSDDPAMLFLALSAWVAFPYVLPQIAKLATGSSPGSPAFQRRWTRQVLSLLRACSPNKSRA